MKLKAVRIKNFRGYKDAGWIEIGNMTGFVGKNDSGKSTILEALDLFFDQSRKLEAADFRKGCCDLDKVEISCAFSQLPNKVVLDESSETTLKDEYLTNDVDELVITKKYTPNQRAEVLVRGKHPINLPCADLLRAKDSKLRALIEKNDIPCDDKTSNVAMRKAIRNFFNSSLQVEEIEISMKADMVDRLHKYLPRYYLFKADRENTEDDIAVRKPITDEIVQLIDGDNELAEHLNFVAQRILSSLSDLMRRALEKLNEVDIPLTCNLQPSLPNIGKLKWADVFKDVTLIGDDEIPMEKRGSGVRRLVLLSFLRAAKELGIDKSKSLIYAIEEPETAQHSDNQRKLMQTLHKVATSEGFQVIVTTHSASVAKEIGISKIRIVDKKEVSTKVEIAKSFLNERLSKSLNFVAYTVFGDCSMEYHNELYGYIEAHGQMKACGNEYVAKYGERLWKRIKNKKDIEEDKSLCYYVRNSIHHPENTKNTPPTDKEVRESIAFMENFINRHKKEFGKGAGK